MQSYTSIVTLPADKDRSTLILNREVYHMDHIKNGPYQLLKKDAPSKSKALKPLEVLKNIELNDNKLYYHLKTTDWPVSRVVYNMGLLGHFCPWGIFELEGIRTFWTFYMSNCSDISQDIYYSQKELKSFSLEIF